MPTRRFLEPIAITVGSQLLQILNKQDLITLLAVNQFIHQIPRQQNANPPGRTPCSARISKWRAGSPGGLAMAACAMASNENPLPDRKSTRLNSSHRCISYAVFC